MDLTLNSNSTDAAIYTTEKRSYELNKTKALKKKIAACNRDTVSIQLTGGGINITFNTGMYEMFRTAVETFYSSTNMENRCTKILVHDKKQRNVESKFKISFGNSSYTLNMYHSTSKCLVNGKMTTSFCNEHLPEIMSSIENELSRCGLTVQDINHAVSEMLASNSSPPSEGKDVIVCDSEVQLRITSDSTDPMHSQQSTNDAAMLTTQLSTYDAEPETIQQFTNDAERERKQQSSTDAEPNITQQSTNEAESETTQQSTNDAEPETTHQSTNDAEPENTQQSSTDAAVLTKQNVYSLLENLQNTVLRLENAMEYFLEKTNQQFSLLRDEICSVKRHSKVYHEHTDRQIEDVEQSTKQLKSAFENISDTHLRKLQAISDAVKIMNQNPQHQKKSIIINADCPLNSFEQEVKKTITKSKSLVIGDSIVRGMRSRNILPNVDIDVNPGKKIADICRKIDNTTMDEYHTVVIYAGGNDAPVRTPLGAIYDNVKATVELLRQSECKVYVCTVCPRRDGSVIPINEVLKRICNETGALLLDAYNAFVYGDGNAVQHFFNSDGIHLSDVGQTKLINCLETVINIVNRNNATHSSPSKTNATGDVERRCDPRRQQLKNAPPYVNSSKNDIENCDQRRKQYGGPPPTGNPAGDVSGYHGPRRQQYGGPPPTGNPAGDINGYHGPRRQQYGGPPPTGNYAGDVHRYHGPRQQHYGAPPPTGHHASDVHEYNRLHRQQHGGPPPTGNPAGDVNGYYGPHRQQYGRPPPTGNHAGDVNGYHGPRRQHYGGPYSTNNPADGVYGYHGPRRQHYGGPSSTVNPASDVYGYHGPRQQQYTGIPPTGNPAGDVYGNYGPSDRQHNDRAPTTGNTWNPVPRRQPFRDDDWRKNTRPNHYAGFTSTAVCGNRPSMPVFNTSPGQY